MKKIYHGVYSNTESGNTMYEHENTAGAVVYLSVIVCEFPVKLILFDQTYETITFNPSEEEHLDIIWLTISWLFSSAKYKAILLTDAGNDAAAALFAGLLAAGAFQNNFVEGPQTNLIIIISPLKYKSLLRPIIVFLNIENGIMKLAVNIPVAGLAPPTPETNVY